MKYDKNSVLFVCFKVLSWFFVGIYVYYVVLVCVEKSFYGTVGLLVGCS